LLRDLPCAHGIRCVIGLCDTARLHLLGFGHAFVAAASAQKGAVFAATGLSDHRAETVSLPHSMLHTSSSSRPCSLRQASERSAGGQLPCVLLGAHMWRAARISANCSGRCDSARCLSELCHTTRCMSATEHAAPALHEAMGHCHPKTLLPWLCCIPRAIPPPCVACSYLSMTQSVCGRPALTHGAECCDSACEQHRCVFAFCCWLCLAPRMCLLHSHPSLVA
jgi:hypothetical protein